MIYFDNAATSFPKPEEVIAAMKDYFFHVGGNTGRSAHQAALKASEIVFETREVLAKLFNISDSSRIVFTKNATEALNFAIYGFLEKGDQVITTSLEHNSVMRPLRHLEIIGKIKLFIVSANDKGIIEPKDFEKILKREKIKLVVVNHASNVTGTIAPIKEIARTAHKYGSTILIDAAQTAGVVNIDVNEDEIDMLAFTGHKSLFGPQGTGGLYIREGIELEPLIRGGTGSNSEEEIQPDFLPDKLESGTPNTIGIAGLGAGVKYVLRKGISEIHQKEAELTECFIKEAEKIERVILYGPRETTKRVAVVSFNITGLTPSEVAYILDQEFGIACRPGLHCAPAAHKTIGTFPQGTVRFSFGYFNNISEIETGIKALHKISRRCV
ncbi:MAG: cysteine desulfurase / selenocysteine lyase [Thermoanaerobacterales bacterium 50_218]|nr:MAG: cysteine desulfurase / selenocysteine lyase [Thermoanaerobacterales bacterium 50_218]HAA90052.1 cysteine desulfurase [Peptococcaceae bacterium]